jgi:hypothetical protein
MAISDRIRAGLWAAHRFTYSPRTTATSAGDNRPDTDALVERGPEAAVPGAELAEAGAGARAESVDTPAGSPESEGAERAVVTAELSADDSLDSASEAEHADTARTTMRLWTTRMLRWAVEWGEGRQI